jgi:hypothetical protein
VTDVVAPLADPMGVSYDKTLRSYTAPFIMAGVNSRVVRRSATLFAGASDALSYASRAKAFQYVERLQMRSLLEAIVVTVGILIFSISLVLPFTRPLLRALLPKPGTVRLLLCARVSCVPPCHRFGLCVAARRRGAGTVAGEEGEGDLPAVIRRRAGGSHWCCHGRQCGPEQGQTSLASSSSYSCRVGNDACCFVLSPYSFRFLASFPAAMWGTPRPRRWWRRPRLLWRFSETSCRPRSCFKVAVS